MSSQEETLGQTQNTLDYISDLAWENLGILPEELVKVAGERTVWASLLKLLPDPDTWRKTNKCTHTSWKQT